MLSKGWRDFFFLFKIHIWEPVVGPKVRTRAPFTQTTDSKCSLLILRKTRRMRSSRQRGCSEVAHRLQNASCIIHQWLLPFSSRPAPTYSRYQRRRLGFNLRLFPLGFACFQLNAGTETKEFTHQLRGPSEEGRGAPRCSRGGSTCTGSSCFSASVSCVTSWLLGYPLRLKMSVSRNGENAAPVLITGWRRAVRWMQIKGNRIYSVVVVILINSGFSFHASMTAAQTKQTFCAGLDGMSPTPLT